LFHGIFTLLAWTFNFKQKLEKIPQAHKPSPKLHGEWAILAGELIFRQFGRE
jgi:hypothetical protein